MFENLLLGIQTPPSAGAPIDYFNQANLEAYFEHIRALALEFPTLWGLICRADDRCRSEHFPRIRRRLERAISLGGTSDFDAKRPWDFTFRAAAEDDHFWNREVRHPALHVMAKHARGTGVAESVGAAAADAASGWAQPSPPKKPRAIAQASELANAKLRENQGSPSGSAGATAGASLPAPPRPPAPTGGGEQTPRGSKKAHPQRRGKFFVTTREGTEICFRFHAGRCEGCERAHACQLCLGPHPNRQCPNKAAKGGSRGGANR